MRLRTKILLLALLALGSVRSAYGQVPAACTVDRANQANNIFIDKQTGYLYACWNNTPNLIGPVSASGGITPPAGDIGGTTPSPTVVATHLTLPLPVNQGGTGTTTPALVPGTNVTISGTWPNQTINSSSGGTPCTTTASSIQYDNAGA